MKPMDRVNIGLCRTSSGLTADSPFDILAYCGDGDEGLQRREMPRQQSAMDSGIKSGRNRLG